MTIKDILKSNKVTFFFYDHIRRLRYDFIPMIRPVYKPIILFNFKKVLRVTRINRRSKFEKLRNIKNKHLGERCFIVATGPSLKIEDLDKLHGEITFSMNSICLAFDETDWRPTYYGIQDIGNYLEFEECIKNLDLECKFIGEPILKHTNVPNEFYIYPMNMLNHYWMHKEYNTKFSDDAFAVVYDGYTITYSLIQIAVYMGFKEIYLLGTDCNYSSDLNHHFKNYSYFDPSYSVAGLKMIHAFKVAKEYADSNNIKIYNATRGGMLEVFERVDLDTVVGKVNKDENLYSLT
ncbi:6-hydroxymethylpterin diphosphokinase MptE-like protein [Gottfriedia luciferensis]|uniref:6-hydroxymethylpterin diphosphokinase MptE-like protein n=1 Tax=Gottfriedia luciferensis TaxID=178774 RepID=UPI000B4483CC|nr:6-hydroxymethylpterin diphosphokinase MptE-like protein [Gottfriedia luciferensis]